MQNPKETILKPLKWLFANLGKSLLSLTLAAIVLYLGGIYHVYKTIWICATILFPLPTPVWATTALVLVVLVGTCLKTSKDQALAPLKRPKHYKYCPECDLGINAKRPESYCHCGTKYLTKCPKCNKKIIRDRSRICSFCGHTFPTKPKTGNEWMAQ